MLILKKFTSFRSFLWFLVALLFAIYLLFGYKYKFIYNYGQSMHPTYKHGEWIIIERIPKNWTPSKGDVIVFQNGWEKLTKRVIALPGEEVKIKHGYIYVNGKKHKDRWSHHNITYWTEPEEDRAKKPKEDWLFLNTDMDVGVIPKGYVWVIGDNRSLSWMGKCRIEDVVGVTLF
tara:strand:+ start:372 stop:896 length:525 start_codon:yes stop_codon:yes gene_type:complete